LQNLYHSHEAHCLSKEILSHLRIRHEDLNRVLFRVQDEHHQFVAK